MSFCSSFSFLFLLDPSVGLDIDGQMIDGVVVEKEKARMTFEAEVCNNCGLLDHFFGRVLRKTDFCFLRSWWWVRALDIDKWCVGVFSLIKGGCQSVDVCEVWTTDDGLVIWRQFFDPYNSVEGLSLKGTDFDSMVRAKGETNSFFILHFWSTCWDPSVRKYDTKSVIHSHCPSSRSLGSIQTERYKVKTMLPYYGSHDFQSKDPLSVSFSSGQSAKFFPSFFWNKYNEKQIEFLVCLTPLWVIWMEAVFTNWTNDGIKPVLIVLL